MAPTRAVAAVLALLVVALHPSSASRAPSRDGGLPLAINTWGGPFTAATDAAFARLREGASALDGAEAGCATCEARQCDGTVGFGGSPDERCETTLDAMIMDGASMKAGAVAGLRRVRHAVAVARRVLEHTAHTMLAGDLATRFAVENGFVEEDLATGASRALCEAWIRERYQPNYRLRVSPDPGRSCGPYSAVPILSPLGLGGEQSPFQSDAAATTPAGRQASHDTISMITIDASGAMAAATSTNGASHKIPGRVGDGPIVGSGSYVDGDVGGCGATGDGDVMMRFLPCYQAVENLRRGMEPTAAAEDAVRRMLRKYPSVLSGVVVVDRHGRHGAAASGWTFTYSFRAGAMDATEVVTVAPLGVRGDVERAAGLTTEELR